MSSFLYPFLLQVKKEKLLFIRQPRLPIQAMTFFVMMVAFFPLTFSPSPAILKIIAPGLIWIAALFAVLLLSEGLFQRDFEEGLLEQAWLSGESFVLVVFGTLCVQLCIIVLGILLLLPLIALLYTLTLNETILLALSIIVGLPTIFFLTAFAAAMNVGRIQKTTLMALLVLPLTTPVLILGAGILRTAESQGSIPGVLALLAAITLLCMGGISFAIEAVLRLRFED